jgi:predicted lactoylglutathione lyase
MLGQRTPYDGGTATSGNGTMVALAADSREQVDQMYAKAIELGGGDEGAPGIRGPEQMGFYGAYFRDPDGNKFCAYKMG